MEFQMNRESEILRNQKEFQRFRKKLFEVHLKPGKAIAKKFENYIDENEYEMSSPDDIRPPRDDGSAALSALETNEATAEAVDVTTAVDATTTADVTTAINLEVAKDGDKELQHGMESTAWTADILEDSAAAIADYHRESVKETPIAGYDDDDDDDDDDDYGDDHNELAIVDENAHEEKKLDCES